MRSHLLTRIATVAVVLGGAAGGMAATAPSAFAIPPGCTGSAMHFTSYGALTSPPEAYAQSYYYWNGCTYELQQPVSISKYVTGVGWEQVATGNGVATYSCTGGPALYTTSVTPSGHDFSCG